MSKTVFYIIMLKIKTIVLTFYDFRIGLRYTMSYKYLEKTHMLQTYKTTCPYTCCHV